jgi:hypothetical protein
VHLPCAALIALSGCNLISGTIVAPSLDVAFIGSVAIDQEGQKLRCTFEGQDVRVQIDLCLI